MQDTRRKIGSFLQLVIITKIVLHVFNIKVFLQSFYITVMALFFLSDGGAFKAVF